MNKIVFGMMLAVLVLLSGNAAAEHHIFYLDPVDSSCDQGNDVTVCVMANTSNNDINSFQASIIFDPSVVNVTLVERGEATQWYTWGWNTFDCSDYNCEEGKKIVKIGGAELMGGYGPGDIQLGKMTLHGEANGISSLHFANESEVGGHRTEIANTSAGVIWPITTEDGTFTCIGSPETFTKPLAFGWNLISLPLTPLDNSTSAVLSGVSQDAVKSYNAATHQFEDATTMDPGTGYFVHVTTAGTWEYEGTAYTSMTATLSQGLNMVGWTNETGSALPGALSSIDGNYRYVARWNADEQKYEVYLPGAPTDFNDFATMDRGAGYFIAATAGCTLAYP